MSNDVRQSGNVADDTSAMKNNKPCLIKYYAIAAFIASGFAVMLRTICLFFFYDHEIGYYSKGIVPTVLNFFCFAAILTFLSALITVKTNTQCSDGKENCLFIRLASIVGLVAFAAYFALSVFSTSLVVFNEFFDLLSKLTALMGVVYFAVNVFCNNSNKKIHTLLGFGIIIWCIYAIAVTYFDIYIQLNSPEKTTLHLALISAMIFIVSELRCFVLDMKKGIYLFSMCAATLLCGTCAIPPFIYTLIKGELGTDKYFIYEVVVFAIGIYAAARLASFVFSKKCCNTDENVPAQINNEEGEESL